MLSASRSLSSRAAQTLVVFMTSVLIGLLLVAPQRAAALGWELLALAVVLGILCSSWTGEPVTPPIRAWPATSRSFP